MHPSDKFTTHIGSASCTLPFIPRQLKDLPGCIPRINSQLACSHHIVASRSFPSSCNIIKQQKEDHKKTCLSRHAEGDYYFNSPSPKNPKRSNIPQPSKQALPASPFLNRINCAANDAKPPEALQNPTIINSSDKLRNKQHPENHPKATTNTKPTTC